MKLRARRTEEPEINLISLIDIFLVLVIFFMLSSTFVNEGRLRVKLPEASTVPVQRQSSERLAITVTASGSYRVNDRELVNSSADTLRLAILKVAGEDRSQAVNIRADGRATHQSVVTAMDVLGQMGFAKLNIVTTNSGGARAP